MPLFFGGRGGCCPADRAVFIIAGVKQTSLFDGWQRQLLPVGYLVCGLLRDIVGRDLLPGASGLAIPYTAAL